MKLLRRQFLHLSAAAAALPAVSRIARAENYPTRPVQAHSLDDRLHQGWQAARAGGHLCDALTGAAGRPKHE
jgi:hypothetical protein